MEENGSTEHM